MPAIIPTTGLAPYTIGASTYETYYKVFGDLSSDKRPLVVAHGGPSLSHDYLLPISDIAAIHDVPIVFYDQVGTGLSTHIPKKKGDTTFWTIDLFIDELFNLLTYLHIEEYDYLGHSWGGMLGLEVVLRRHPRGMKNFVLANSLADGASWDKSFTQLLQAPDVPEDVRQTIMDEDADRAERYAALKVFYKVYGCMVDPLPEDFLRSMDYTNGENADRTTVDALNAGDLSNWDVRDKLGEIDVPTLVINGARDFAQDWVVAPFVENIPDVKWVKFENSSHTPFWEERDEFNRVVAEYLGY
ncbi:proline-specific peptidase [Schizophyllum commune Tattone D]|nr:proline-specific peptidase [Schizophyllum commune Tattone D]